MLWGEAARGDTPRKPPARIRGWGAIPRSGLAPHPRRKNAYLLTVSSDCISVAVSPNPKKRRYRPYHHEGPYLLLKIQAIPPRRSVSPAEDTGHTTTIVRVSY